MGGFRGGPRGTRLTFYLGFIFFFFNFLNGIRVILCNRKKDFHVLWIWSDVALPPKCFRPPLSKFSGSARGLAEGLNGVHRQLSNDQKKQPSTVE